MRCKYCGSEIEPGAVFCTACGNRVEEEKTDDKSAQPWYAGQDGSNTAIPQGGTAGGSAAGAGTGGSGKKAVVLAILYGALTVLGVLLNELLIFARYSSLGMSQQLIGQMFSARVVYWGIYFFELLISAIPIVIVLISRKKHLWKVKTKDVVLVVIFMVASWIISLFENLFVTQLAARFGSMVSAGYSVAQTVVGMVSLSIIVNGVAVALLILARTGSKKGAVILGVITTLVLLFITAVVMIAPMPFVRMLSVSPELMDFAVAVTRTSIIMVFLSSISMLMIAACYGFSSPRSKRWLPVILITTIGKLIFTIALIGIILAVSQNGSSNGIAGITGLTSLGTTVPMVLSAVLMLAAAIRNRNNI